MAQTSRDVVRSSRPSRGFRRRLALLRLYLHFNIFLTFIVVIWSFVPLEMDLRRSEDSSSGSFVSFRRKHVIIIIFNLVHTIVHLIKVKYLAESHYGLYPLNSSNFCN